jgi:hypothetical protein
VQVLQTDVTAALAREFRRPSASLRLDRIATVEAGRRFLRIDAIGVAYLDRQSPATPLTIQALIDRTSGAWLRLDYGVGAGPTGGLPSLAIH